MVFVRLNLSHRFCLTALDRAQGQIASHFLTGAYLKVWAFCTYCGVVTNRKGYRETYLSSTPASHRPLQSGPGGCTCLSHGIPNSDVRTSTVRTKAGFLGKDRYPC